MTLAVVDLTEGDIERPKEGDDFLVIFGHEGKVKSIFEGDFMIFLEIFKSMEHFSYFHYRL